MYSSYVQNIIQTNGQALYLGLIYISYFQTYFHCAVYHVLTDRHRLAGVLTDIVPFHVVVEGFEYPYSRTMDVLIEVMDGINLKNPS